MKKSSQTGLLRYNNFLENTSRIQKEMNSDFWLVMGVNHNINSLWLLGLENIGPHAILIPKKGDPVIFCNGMTSNMLKRAGFGNIVFEKRKDLYELIKKEIQIIENPKIALDFYDKGSFPSIDQITLGLFNELKNSLKVDIVSSEGFLWKIRSKKTNYEINNHIYAMNKISNLLKNLKEPLGKKETDVEADFVYELRKQGLKKIDVIVASCENSADPHHNTSSKKIKKGILLIDCFARYKTSFGDLTTTYCIGSPSQKQKETYNLIKNVLRLAIDKFNIGTQIFTLDNFVRTEFKKQKLDKYFIHSTGHSLGVECHDLGPFITKKSKASSIKVLDKMVFAVEPALYFDKWGIRLEMDVIFDKVKNVLGFVPENIRIL